MREKNERETVAILRRRLRLGGPLIAVTAIFLLAFATQSAAQRQRDVLTDQQTEDLREHADQPEEKLKLFVGYIEQRTAEIHQLNANRSEPNWSTGIHNRYEEFTELCDELQDNMDSYDEQHEDLRKALKLIVEKSAKWPSVLNEPEASTDYDFVRKTALDACQSVVNAAKQMIEEQAKYFAARKKEEKSSGN